MFATFEKCNSKKMTNVKHYGLGNGDYSVAYFFFPKKTYIHIHKYGLGIGLIFEGSFFKKVCYEGLYDFCPFKP